MELSKDTLETIGSYVKGNLPAWLRELSPEALGQTDLRIAEQQIQYLDKRFEQMDKRFEEQRGDMHARFDDMHRHTNRWMTALLIVVG